MKQITNKLNKTFGWNKHEINCSMKQKPTNISPIKRFVMILETFNVIECGFAAPQQFLNRTFYISIFSIAHLFSRKPNRTCKDLSIFLLDFTPIRSTNVIIYHCFQI